MQNNLSNMMCLDIYLSSLDTKEANRIKNQIEPLECKPLLSWDISNTSYLDVINKNKTEIDSKKIKFFAKKYNWKNDFHTLFLENDFEALVLTDLSEKIIWVNDGFTKMTGYSKSFVLNKHPNFLQGTDTSKQTKELIKLNLKDKKPFELCITNYKKNKTPYLCQIKVFPLYSNESSNQITHFLALEKQIR